MNMFVLIIANEKKNINLFNVTEMYHSFLTNL